MNLLEAKILALSLMDKHGLVSDGWELRFDQAKRRFGVCNLTRKTIGLSSPLVSANPEEEVENTILHEIAHALSVKRYGAAGRGHGPLWKAVCCEIGANPERCFSPEKIEVPRGQYVLRHRETGEVYRNYYRFPSKTAKRVDRIWIKGKEEETLGKLEIVAEGTPLGEAPSLVLSVRSPQVSMSGYVLRHKETGEVFKYYKRTPKNLSAPLQNLYIVGKKEETIGKLEIVLKGTPLGGGKVASSAASEVAQRESLGQLRLFGSAL